MKKIILSLVVMAAVVTATAQKFNYKVGVVTSLPASVTYTHVLAGSTMLEASTKISKKLNFVGNTGYLRLSTTQDAKLSQVPVLVGVKYSINPNWYFGAGAGITVPTKKTYGSTEFGYSPYLGYQKNHISVDTRYYLSGLQTPISTMCLVFSYSL